MSQDTTVRAADPLLTRLADAILIPPFPGASAPPWILDALGRGLAGVKIGRASCRERVFNWV